MSALDTLQRKNLLLVFRQLAQKLYAIQSAKSSKENVESLCREQQEKYIKSMRYVKIAFILFWILFFQYPTVGIMMGITGLNMDKGERGDGLLAHHLLLVCVCAGILVLFLIITFVVYNRIKRKKQKALSDYLNAVQPYIPFFDNIMQNEANACYAFCTKFSIPQELQNYNAATFIYNELSVSSTLPLYAAIEHYRNHVHRREMEAYASRQNDLLREQIEQDKAYYQDMLREASENNELLRSGNQQRQDIYNYIRYGY